MSVQLQEFVPVLPEIFVLGMACFILIVDLFLTERTRSITYLLSQATLVGAFLLTLGLSSIDTQVVLSGTVILDPKFSSTDPGLGMTEDGRSAVDPLDWDDMGCERSDRAAVCGKCGSP